MKPPEARGNSRGQETLVKISARVAVATERDPLSIDLGVVDEPVDHGGGADLVIAYAGGRCRRLGDNGEEERHA